MIRETASTYHITLRDPDGWTFEIDCAADQTILDAVIEAGLRLPEMCSQGWCLTCAGRLLKGKVDHSLARRYFEQDEAGGYVLLCTARPLADCVILTHQKTNMVLWRTEHSLPAPRG